MLELSLSLLGHLVGVGAAPPARGFTPPCPNQFFDCNTSQNLLLELDSER
jgi:hypothetical protein